MNVDISIPKITNTYIDNIIKALYTLLKIWVIIC